MIRSIWFTGQPLSGKTTVSRLVADKMHRPVLLLDGDEVRTWLTPDCDYSADGRRKNVLRVAEVAARAVDAGAFPIVALVSPIAADRLDAWRRLGPTCLTVALQAPMWVLMGRDHDRRYHRSDRVMTYEAAHDAKLQLDTHVLSPDATVDRVLAWMRA